MLDEPYRDNNLIFSKLPMLFNKLRQNSKIFISLVYTVHHTRSLWKDQGATKRNQVEICDPFLPGPGVDVQILQTVRFTVSYANSHIQRIWRCHTRAVPSLRQNCSGQNCQSTKTDDRFHQKQRCIFQSLACWCSHLLRALWTKIRTPLSQCYLPTHKAAVG